MTHDTHNVELAMTQVQKLAKNTTTIALKQQINAGNKTPLKPIKASETAPRTSKTTTTTTTTVAASSTTSSSSKATSKHKATRKLKFDEETSSPVSGTIIRPLEDITDGGVQYSNGDVDPRYNIVEISEESKAELAAIKNVIGDYICKLCRLKFDDAFGLARHRCACIVLLEYRCPECGKQFNCPANLASHRRWHKPKKESASMTAKKENQNTMNTVTVTTNMSHACGQCGKKFKRQAYLRKHMSTHGKPQAAKTQDITATVKLSKQTVSATVLAIAKSSASVSVSSSEHYNGSNSSISEEELVFTAHEYDADTLSDCSSQSSISSSPGYGRLQIVESGLTEEENIAATALTNLRNCASVIKHTTLAH